MRKYHIILLLFLGLLLTPGSVMACDMENSKPTCEKEMITSNIDKKCCCDNDNSKESESKGCEGNCMNSKCGCTSNCTSVSVSFLSDSNFTFQEVYFSLFKKVSFSYTTPSISDGFYSIWLIPKIS